ncbi:MULTISPECIES: nitroreductase family protein [Bacteroides]|uniref:nitroreductase family protein n=1 Tax=Bacteroides TaxID=816 RepID=UPI001D661A37|nr:MULTISPECIES: nitroreductase family protein [Bacteroides]HJD91381.1 nitroreductase family protein [Bacteroides coprosuis]
MDFLELVQSRQSDRKFDASKPIEAEKLDYILQAAHLSPSACNAQPWKIIVVSDADLCEQVGKAAAGLGMNSFAKNAPLHLLIVEESANITSLLGSKIKGKYYPLMDIGILASHISLAAEYLGLGSCIMGWFDENKIKDLLSIPSKKRVLLDIAIGYSLAEKKKKKRKPIESIISHNKY